MLHSNTQSNINVLAVLLAVSISTILPGCGGGGSNKEQVGANSQAPSDAADVEDLEGEWTTIKVVRSKNAVLKVFATAEVVVNDKNRAFLMNGETKEFKVPAKEGNSEFFIRERNAPGPGGAGQLDHPVKFFSARPGAYIVVEVDLGALDGEVVRSFEVVKKGRE